MEAIDNPSYFSLPDEPTSPTANLRQFLSLRRRWSDVSKNITNRSSPPNCANTFAARSASMPRARRHLRSLKRANSEDTRLLVLGKPRPSDLPPIVYPSSNVTGDDVDARRRRNSAGNVDSDLLHQDMIHCGGAVPDGGDDSDVFVNENRQQSINAQYYNTSTLPVGRVSSSTRRRHSIGTFLHRDRSFVPAPTTTTLDCKNSAKETAMRKKFKRISIEKVGAKMIEDELDILMVSCGESEVATMWVDYLISCFQRISVERKKPPFKLYNIKLEDVLSLMTNSINVNVKYPSARLQIIIVCPVFLEKIRISPIQRDNPLSKILHLDKVLAMMLGVTDDGDDNRMKTMFPNYEHWRKMQVKDQDPTSVGDFLGVSMDILSRTWQMQEIINSKYQEQTYFSVIPKKVKVGQDKLIVSLVEPLQPEDNIKIFINRNNQQSEVNNVKRRNPYTLQFTMPGNCLQVSMLVGINVEKNGNSIGKRVVKCESRMRELEQLLKLLDDPLNFLCQSFGLNTCDRDYVDSFLLANFLKNTPPNFNLLNPFVPVNRNYACNEEFPTLLHFASKYGFEKLACQLIESPGGEQACQIRNSSHLTPAEIAERSNHNRLANALKGHIQMTELASMYNYLKGLSGDNFRRYTENNYLLPRPVSDTYLIPPAARPVDPRLMTASAVSAVTPTAEMSFIPSYENFKSANMSSIWPTTPSPTSPTYSTNWCLPAGIENYETPRNGRPCTPRTPPTPLSPTEKKIEGYLDMNHGSESSNFGSLSSFGTHADFHEQFGNLRKSENYHSMSTLSDGHPFTKYGSVHHLSSKEKLSPDDELLEIINDFKNNVFTIKEVEKLVQEWQNRSDVQQSYKEKQEQLNQMREEYERIQREMKASLKRPTPFERFRKFFSRGKSKQCDNQESKDVHIDNPCHQMRASSSVSLHSSSSGSSGSNSISNGSIYGHNVHGECSNKTITKTASFEKQYKKKLNVYADVPHPPKYLDLSSNGDFSEYVQSDCMVCHIGTGTSNRINDCSPSILNDTIPECIELDPSEAVITDTKRIAMPHYSYHNFSQNESKHSKTNSLKTPSKHKRKHIKSKVKSAENLLYGSMTPYASSWEPPNILQPSRRQHSSVSSLSPSTELTSCRVFCNETVKCSNKLNDSSVPTTSTEPEEETNAVNDEEEVNVTFEFDAASSSPPPSLKNDGCRNQSAPPSDNDDSVNNSRKSSSLDLSSLSLNSNCTVDENGDIKCSLELKISEPAEHESEMIPPMQNVGDEAKNSYLNLCKIPDYMNVNGLSKEARVASRFKYATTVSS